MHQRHVSHKVLSVTICFLYLSLSLFAISCAYHCGFKDDLPPSHQHAVTHHSTGDASEQTTHDHHHSNDDQQDESDHDKVLFCKFLHKAGSSVITASHIVIAGLGFSIRELPVNSVVAYQQTDIIYLSRAPPYLS